MWLIVRLCRCGAQCSAVETPEAHGATEDDRPFVTVVRDPAGVTYHVQAVPVSSASGPVLLGGRDGPASHGLLGLANRFLAKHGRTQTHDGFGVFVYRDEPGGPIVAESEHGSMPQARQAAKEFVRAIENGMLPS
jgi:hypothetical protein